jgi:phosphoglycerate dehydrogenase-like enzyme
MPITLAMFDQSHAHIAPRLDALGLDLDIMTFDRSGTFSMQGRRVPPQEISVDYFWLSQHINAHGFRDKAFETVLACRQIGVLQTFNAGLDMPAYRKLADKGVRICNSSAQGIAIAEYTLGQVISVLQPIEHQRSLQAARTWQQTPFRELSQTDWLIIGFGPIGQEVAKRVQAFGASASVIRRTPHPTPLARRVGTMADLNRFLSDADVVLIACPLNATTRGFADRTFFQHIKPGAIIVNIARGPLIDDAALLAALDNGRVSRAILDVFRTEPLPIEDPLWTHPSVRMTSHTSFAGSGVGGRWDALFLDNIQRFANGQPLVNEVDPRDIG